MTSALPPTRESNYCGPWRTVGRCLISAIKFHLISATRMFLWNYRSRKRIPSLHLLRIVRIFLPASSNDEQAARTPKNELHEEVKRNIPPPAQVPWPGIGQHNPESCCQRGFHRTGKCHLHRRLSRASLKNRQ